MICQRKPLPHITPKVWAVYAVSNTRSGGRTRAAPAVAASVLRRESKDQRAKQEKAAPQFKEPISAHSPNPIRQQRINIM